MLAPENETAVQLSSFHCGYGGWAEALRNLHGILTSLSLMLLPLLRGNCGSSGFLSLFLGQIQKGAAGLSLRLVPSKEQMP